jgi:NitT/TauT family transport system substrate-binding protein
MSRKILILLSVTLLICLGVLLFCYLRFSDAQRSISHKSTLYLNWIYTGSFAGEIVGWKEFASRNGLNLTIQQGGQGLDPLKLVKNDDFGTAGADEILRANEKGADYVIIGVINDDSPTAFLALKSSGISKPQDFIGKRVGILPFGSTGLVYQSLLKRNNIDRKQVSEVVVSPDLRPFLTAHTHDVQPVFAYDEPVTLDRQHISYNLILPKDYGVSFKGPCYFTRRETIHNHPELVYAFVETMAQGWAEAVARPDHAIDLLKEVDPQIDRSREREVLKRGLPYYATADRKPLQSRPESWEPMLDDLVSFQILTHKPALESFLDLSFVNRFYSQSH